MTPNPHIPSPPSGPRLKSYILWRLTASLWNQTSSAHILASPLRGCVTLGKSLNLSVPQFPLPQSGSDSAPLQGWLQRRQRPTPWVGGSCGVAAVGAGVMQGPEGCDRQRGLSEPQLCPPVALSSACGTHHVTPETWRGHRACRCRTGSVECLGPDAPGTSPLLCLALHV